MLRNFRCPAFSIAGNGLGATRTDCQLIVHIIAFLRHAQPKTFIPENVTGSLQRHKGTLCWIVHTLKSLCGVRYQLHVKAINAKAHGIPQSRGRLWLIGIKAATASPARPFVWPASPPRHIASQSVLGSTQWWSRSETLSHACWESARANCINGLKQTFQVM